MVLNHRILQFDGMMPDRDIQVFLVCSTVTVTVSCFSLCHCRYELRQMNFSLEINKVTVVLSWCCVATETPLPTNHNLKM